MERGRPFGPSTCALNKLPFAQQWLDPASRAVGVISGVTLLLTYVRAQFPIRIMGNGTALPKRDDANCELFENKSAFRFDDADGKGGMVGASYLRI